MRANVERSLQASPTEVRTNKLRLLAAVWHGFFDYVTACTECKSGLIAAIGNTLIMVWAVALVIVFKRPNLSHKERQML